MVAQALMDENFAAKILRVAIKEGRSAELLDSLFNGGSVTVDARGYLVIMSGDMVQQLMGNTS